MCVARRRKIAGDDLAFASFHVHADLSQESGFADACRTRHRQKLGTPVDPFDDASRFIAPSEDRETVGHGAEECTILGGA